MSNSFWNEHHEVLYALFIMESNMAINPIHTVDDLQCNECIVFVMFNYMNQWEDRAVCDE